jgi:hypothetical protein
VRVIVVVPDYFKKVTVSLKNSVSFAYNILKAGHVFDLVKEHLKEK